MSIAVAAASEKGTTGHDPVRVMVVDDSALVRGLIARWIEAEADLHVVAALRSGREAIEQVERTNTEVVILDVDMPDIDGIAALPRLFEKKRDLVVIMASALTRRNAEVSLRALALGAADYIPKPDTTQDSSDARTFRRELVEKIRALGMRRRRFAKERQTPATLVPASGPLSAGADAGERPPIKLRPFPAVAPRVLLIGASTGGPQALYVLASGLNRVIDSAPVLITQHMPPTFTSILAEQLARASGRETREGKDGELVRAGRIYVAPGGRHMRVVRRDGVAVIALDDGAPVNFCKPAVDPLFTSAAEVWGGWNAAVVLTGMGSDGSRGAAAIVAHGGCVIAQDEASSVVWGMPGVVAHGGLCSAVLPLDAIAPAVVRLFCGARK